MRADVFKSGCVGLAPSSGLLVHLCPVDFIESVFQLEQIGLHLLLFMSVWSCGSPRTCLVSPVWLYVFGRYFGRGTLGRVQFSSSLERSRFLLRIMKKCSGVRSRARLDRRERQRITARA